MPITISMSEDEFNAIIALLRWGANWVEEEGWGDYEEIADNSGEGVALTPSQLNNLCDRLLG